MLAVLLGVGVAAAAVWGPLRWFDVEVLNMAATVTQFGSAAASSGLERIDQLQTRPDLVEVATSVTAVALPGVLALLLSRVASQVAAARSLVAAVLVVAAMASFWFVSPGQAVVLTVVAVASAVIVAVPLSLLIRAGVWAVIAVIGFRHVPAVINGSDVTVAASTETLIRLTGMESADSFWRLVLTVFSIAPFVFVASAALTSGD